MHHILRILGTRYGAALGLLLLIAMVVGIGKVAGGHPDTPGTAGPPIVATDSYPPDDGLDSPPPVVSPSTSPGAPGPQQVALSFTRSWLHHTGISQAEWHAGLAPYATGRLSDELADTDPSAVPANELTGDPTLVPHAASYVDVILPLDSGTLDLRLIADQGRWLVDGVDWQRP